MQTRRFRPALESLDLRLAPSDVTGSMSSAYMRSESTTVVVEYVGDTSTSPMTPGSPYMPGPITPPAPPEDPNAGPCDPYLF